MDINRLCPGCMRELDVQVRKAEMERGNAEKCPYCGFDAAIYRQNARCLPINTILAGKYLVGAVLGEGGFGITYMGYDLNMETRIAIKEYFPVELVSRDTTSMTGDRVISMGGDKSVTYRQGLKKYVTEAQNVSRFSETSGVVSVKDFFYENETAYIVMEYIEGISLKDYLKEQGGRLSEEESLAVMKPVLEALVKVHEAGIIHRDISPDNIMLTFSDGQTTENAGKAAGDSRHIDSVRLIDFGAARMTARDDQKSLTIILKHGYAPEEQYRTHGEQGPWTDVYAVCAVLYRMLTGETPVPAMDRLFQDGLKSFDDLSANVTKPVQAAVLQGLAVKKENRIQSMEELLQILYGGKTAGNQGLFSKPKTWTAILGGTALIGIAVAIGILFPQKAGSVGETAVESLFTEASDNMPVEITAGTGVKPGQSDVDEPGDMDESSQETVPDGSDADEGAQETILKENSEAQSAVQPVISRPEILENGYKQIMDGYFSEINLIVRADGTVSAQSYNEEIAEEAGEWTDICAVAAGAGFCAGLRTDGTVVVADQSDLAIRDAQRWKDIISIRAGSGWLIGLCLDGTVCSAGDNSYGQCEVSSWTQIQAVATARTYTTGVREDGSVLLVGEEMAVRRGEKEAEERNRIIGEGWEDVV